MPDKLLVQSATSLLLAGRTIHEGDQLILQIFGGEIEGVARHSRTGWYLLTAAQVRIRLSEGLLARWENPESSSHPGEREQEPPEAGYGRSNDRQEEK